MRDELLDYYERELRFIRRSAAEFAAKYPAIAGRLLLEPEKCEDPHVERIIEAFAMLSARVHLRLDDAFPELTDALLGVLYPHYTPPVPSMTVVQMQLDPSQGAAAEGTTVDRHSILFASVIFRLIKTASLESPCLSLNGKAFTSTYLSPPSSPSR